VRNHHRPGLNVLTVSNLEFARVIKDSRHTLKRALTRPALIDGIGNAYSDEILHAARLSPIRLTTSLSDDEIARLYTAARDTLDTWIDRLAKQFSNRFPRPAEITAFRPDFAVHGKFEHPCPVCATPVARIRYKANETNYCPQCQTNGRLLADRSLSRLLKGHFD
jgi:formamidopyrimidine-DNA glycosylase